MKIYKLWTFLIIECFFMANIAVYIFCFKYLFGWFQRNRRKINKILNLKVAFNDTLSAHTNKILKDKKFDLSCKIFGK